MNKHGMELNVSKWLENGAFCKMPLGKFLVSWGVSVKATSPLPGKYAYFTPDFYLEEGLDWVHFEHNLLMTGDEIKSNLLNKKFDNNLDWFEPDRKEFQNTFDKIKKEITSGQSYSKLVPVVFSTSRSSQIKEQLSHIIETLLVENQEQFPYGFWSKETKTGIVGITPEVLFSVKEKELESMALAGTHDVNRPEGSLLSCSKEMSEHQFVIDALRESLGKISNFTQKTTYEWSLNQIKHLRTDFTAKLKKSFSYTDLVKLFHPTPALGCAPKNLDWKVLKNYESNWSRQRYGAPFAVSSPGNECLCLVGIRNLQWQGDELFLGSGCGLVQDSELDKEWGELNLKRQSVKNYLRI